LKRTDVAIVGAGVIGCAIARELALRGFATAVIDRDEPGTHASWAAAGMLAPLVEADRADPFLHLLRASARLFPGLARALREETGIDVAHASEGTLLLALDPRDDEALERRFRWQSRAGLPVVRLDRDATLELEPAISGGVRSALHFPEDTQVDNRLLGEALARAARGAGAEMVRATVERVVVEEGRARALELGGGQRVEAEFIVIAAGCWSGRIAGLPRPLPVRPVHGQLIALRAEPGLLGHVVDSPRVYLVPRRDGRVIVGTTTEETGFRKAVTPEAVARLREAAAEAVPALAAAELAESWSGLRPGTPDSLPILGADPEVQGLLYATGHFRNGILLAPITAQLLAELVTDGQPELDLTAFSVERFGNGSWTAANGS
jgi:glycine oxidase